MHMCLCTCARACVHVCVGAHVYTCVYLCVHVSLCFCSSEYVRYPAMARAQFDPCVTVIKMRVLLLLNLTKTKKHHL